MPLDPIINQDEEENGYDEFDRNARIHSIKWIGINVPFQELVQYQHDPSRVLGPPISPTLKSPEERKRELDELIAKQAKIDEEVAENRKTIEKIQNINSVISQLDKIIEKYSE